PTQLNRVVEGQLVFRLLRGELNRAELHAAEIRKLAETVNDPLCKFNSYSLTATVYCWLGKLVEAHAYYKDIFALWDPNFRTDWMQPQDLYVGNLIYFSRILLCLGYVDQARTRRDEAIAESLKLSRYNQIFALRHAWYGEWAADGLETVERMLRSAEKILAVASEQGFPMFVGAGQIMRGWCLTVTGQAEEGIPLFRQGLANYAATGTKLVTPFYLVTLAESYGRTGQPKEGLQRLAEAADLIETTEERWAEAEIHRMRGTLLLLTNDRVAAEESYLRAIEVARRQSAKFWELRATLDLARLWRGQGKCAEARDLLAPVYGWFTEGFDTPDLKEAKALLQQLTE